jgi:hypothetical protein
VRSRYIARAGIVKAMALMENDTNEVDTLRECGVLFGAGDTPEKTFGPDTNKLEGGAFSVHYRIRTGGGQPATLYGMVDEERKVDLSIQAIMKCGTAEYKKTLKRLSALVTDDVADAIVNWQNAAAGQGVFSASDALYYGSAERPYECKHDAFETVEELRLVRGMTPEVFNDIKDEVTIYGTGLVNLNTASERVVNAVLNDDAGNYSGLVRKIMAFRRGSDGADGTPDDGSFSGIDDLTRKIPLDPVEAGRLSYLAYRLTFKSSVFMIVSHGVTDNIERVITAVIERDGLKMRYYHEE